MVFYSQHMVVCNAAAEHTAPFLYSDLLYFLWHRIKYSQTSLQWAPWEQMKLMTVPETSRCGEAGV